jgi:Kelch motif/Galactose oxidase, central domain
MDNDPRDDENQIGIHAMIEQEASGEMERQQQQHQQQHQFQQPNETSTNNATSQLPNLAAAAAAAGLLFQQHAAGSASGSAPTARSSSLIYHHRGAGAGAGGSGNANSSSSQQQQHQLRHQASVSSYASASGTSSTSSSLYYASSQHYGGRFGADAARLPFRGGVPERDAEQLQEEDGLEFSPASGWSEVELSQDGGGSPPSARSLHAAAVLNGTLLVFGGYDGNQRVNTFHAYSFAEKRWSPVHPSAGSAPAPSPRDRHVMVAFGNSIFIHGGFDGVSRVGDLFCFDFSTMMWREIRALEGRAPSPRHSHSAVVYGSSLFIFGGYDGSYKNDLHECDLLSSRWGVVPAAGRRPRARYRATLCVHRSSMVLFGGHDGTRHLQDVHVFDLETRIWSNLVCEGVPPTPRDSHVSVMHGNCM